MILSNLRGGPAASSGSRGGRKPDAREGNRTIKASANAADLHPKAGGNRGEDASLLSLAQRRAKYSRNL